jgi:hypothetical protein
MTALALRVLIGATVVALLGCGTAPQRKHVGESASAQRVIESYLKATNDRDLLMLTAYVTPDFEWVSLVGGERIVEVQSREALAATLREYFVRYPTSTLRNESLQVVDGFVVVSERSEWQASDGKGERTSLGVYELFDGRIRRVTYFLNSR